MVGSVRNIYSFMVVMDVEGTDEDSAREILDTALLDVIDIERELDAEEQIVSFGILSPAVTVMDDVDLLELEDEDYTDDVESSFESDPDARYA